MRCRYCHLSPIPQWTFLPSGQRRQMHGAKSRKIDQLDHPFKRGRDPPTVALDNPSCKAPEPTTAASVEITRLHYSIEFRNSTQIVDQRSIFTGPIYKIGESTCALFSRGLCWCGTECLREHYIKFPIRHTGSHGVELLSIRSAKIAGGRLLGVQRG